MGTLAYVLSGALTETSIDVTASTTSAASVRLLTSLSADLSSPTYTAATAPDAQGINKWPLTGLTPDTEYHYAVEVDGVLDTTKPGRFRTAPVATGSHSIASSSCAATNVGPKVFASIAARQPLLFVHGGDFHYLDIATNDPALFRAGIAAQLDRPNYGLAFRNVPIAYMPDDHDRGPNNSDRTSPSLPASTTAYKQVVPHYPIQGTGDLLYQAWTFGRVRHILTDLRGGADPDTDPDTPTKTMMGAEQKAWFKQEITDAVADPDIAYIVWHCTRIWLTRGTQGTGDDSWGLFSHERQEIANHIATSGAGAMGCMIAGDAHYQGVHTGSRLADFSTTGGGMFWPVFNIAPLNQIPGTDPNSYGPFDHYAGLDRYVYGELVVTDPRDVDPGSDDPLELTWNVWHTDETTGVEMLRSSYSFSSVAERQASSLVNVDARVWDGYGWQEHDPPEVFNGTDWEDYEFVAFR